MAILKIEPQVANSTANFSFGNVFASNFYYANGTLFSGGGSGTVKYTANSAPPLSNNSPGDQWFNTTSQTLYEYINDGTSNYWVDILSPTVTSSSFTANTVISGNSNITVNQNSNIALSVSGTSNVIVASNTAVAIKGNITITNVLLTGITSTTLTSPLAVFSGSGAYYTQVGLYNTIGNGSADIITYGNNGDDTQSWADMGFTGNSFNDANYTVTAPGDGYFFTQGNTNFGGNMVIATGSVGTTKDIIFATGGFLTSNIKARLYNSNGAFAVTGNINAGNLSVPTGTLTANIGSIGNLTVTGNLIAAGAFTLQQTYEVIITVGTISGTVAYDYTLGGSFYHATPASAWVVNIINLPTTANRVNVLALIINQGATGYFPSAYQINGNAVTVKWSFGTTPTASNSKIDILSLSCMYIGGSWIVVGQAGNYS